MFAMLVSSLLGLAAPGQTPAAPPAAREGASPATVVVTLPADARLTVDGEATKSTSGMRRFVTPPLRPGKKYGYTFKAEFVRQGQMITVARKVPVEAGRQTAVSLDLPGTAVGPAALPQWPVPPAYRVYYYGVSPGAPGVARGYTFHRFEPDPVPAKPYDPDSRRLYSLSDDR
jgi:uncharacterized protein (TIGR03000 family)